MADHVKNRLTAFNKIANLEKKIDNFVNAPFDMETVEEYFEQIDHAWSQVEGSHQFVLPVCVDAEAERLQADVFDKMFDDYQDVRCKLRRIAKRLAPVPSNPGHSSSQPNVRLPAMELPTFDGSFETWTSFKDLFGAAVGGNSSLSDAQKLQYLKAAVKGKAAEQISTLQTIDANYSEAWKILESTYNNQREIVHTLITKMMTFRTVRNESASELQALEDGFIKCLTTLKVIGRPVDEWDDLIVNLVVSKLDQNTKREWAVKQTGTDLPTLEELWKFLKGHIRGLLAIGTSSQFNSREIRKERGIKVHHAAAENNCLICSKPHAHHKCYELIRKSPSERRDLIKGLSLCFVCLGPQHMSSNCESTLSCGKCGKRHHSLLHLGTVGGGYGRNPAGYPQSARVAAPVKSVGNSGNKDNEEKAGSYHVESEDNGVLMTAVVHVEDRFGRKQPCRVFIDPGSQGQFITEECVNRLGIPRQASQVTVSGLAGVKVGRARGMVDTVLISQFKEESTLPVNLHILSKLTGHLPTVRCRVGSWKHLDGLQLADPQWFNPSPVDILIGIKSYHLVQLCNKKVGLERDAPVAWDTIFGWVVSGTCPSSAKSQLSFHLTIDKVYNLVKRFWEVEEPPKVKILTKEEKVCETHFLENFSRDVNGRFVVGIPFNQKKGSLGTSRELAIKRWKQVERRLQRQPHFKKQYLQFMKEYIDLGHMVRVPENEPKEEIGKTLHLCHHGVVNESSTTTKMRVVFDGSAGTSTGVSINEAMYVGATLQDDLYDILLRFRVHTIVIKADIAKMFRQFLLKPEDSDMHRIVFREDPNDELIDYKLSTVTYGTACAPNLATRCLKQLAVECKETYPLGSAVLDKDAYVDDILSGTSSVEEAISLYGELSKAVATAGMELRKWTSNSPAVLAAIPEELRETVPCTFETEDQLIKALGVQWHPTADVFTFKGLSFKHCGKVTKRQLFSDLAKVFDPLGLVSCVTLRGKILLQKLWLLSIDWDEQVPDHIQQQWDEYKLDLDNLMKLSIPRQIKMSPISSEIHVFSDSSESAYGSIVYIRSVWSDGSVTVCFVTSKTHVAPLKQISLPRLELDAAKQGAELGTHVKETLSSSYKGALILCMWSDSMIVIKWIESQPRRWKTYVANRVAAIQELTPVSCWRHVAGKDNPADLASRGVPAQDILENEFWWRGPVWLSFPIIPQFSSPPPPLSVYQDEEKSQKLTVGAVVTESDWLCKFSSLHKLKRVTVYILRFIKLLKSKRDGSSLVQSRGPIQPSELEEALKLCIKIVQQQYFCEDIKQLEKCGRVKSNSKLKTLVPYIDSAGIVRVTGRLQKAVLNDNRKHHVIVPGEAHLTKLLIDDVHHRHFHCGFQLTFSLLSSEYWILKGRDRVRFFLRSCVVCKRYRAKTAEQLMGNLPSPRVQPSRPFLHVGVDYAGPFTLRESIGRGKKTFKGYICLFVCMASKAIHLERALSLSTEAFIAALRRFVARRGLCAHIYSDCGTNFVGAEKEIKSYVRSRAVNVAVADSLSKDGITWHFNAPASPHHGGLWEAGVKSVKYHLRRTIGTMTLTDDQFTTLLAQVEAVCNSRPLYQQSSDPKDMEALTPAHLLIGGPLTTVPDVDVHDIPMNRLSQFQVIQNRVQHFWRKWSLEYLNTLQQRNKWMWQQKSVSIGDLVLIVEETPPNTWKMGRIIEVESGADGLVRIVTVQTASSTFKRPIVKLVPLLSNE